MKTISLSLGVLYLAGAVYEALNPDGFRRFMQERVGDRGLGRLGVRPSPEVEEYFAMSARSRRWWAITTRVIPGLFWVWSAGRRA